MIYTVTLNPAVDKILFLGEFQQSRTNRLTQSLETIGGKGTHVTINLGLLGVQSTALGIALGENGRKIIRMLESAGNNACFLNYDMPGMESRTNYELVETSSRICTMLAERGPLLPRNITDDLLSQIRHLLVPGDTLVLTGDASNVEDTAIYSELTLVANELGGKVFLDASGDYLMQALPSHPFLIKPNLEELSFVVGEQLNSEGDIVAALEVLDRFNIPVIAMTWSRDGAIVKSGQEIFRVRSIQVDTVNEAGCGDAFLAGILAGMDRHLGMADTLQLAAGVAAAAAESAGTVGFDVARAEHLRNQAAVTKIH